LAALGSVVSITLSLSGLCLYLGIHLKVHRWVDAHEILPFRLLALTLVTVAIFWATVTFVRAPSGVVLLIAGAASAVATMLMGVVRRDDLAHLVGTK
jgi:hypothetical protein